MRRYCPVFIIFTPLFIAGKKKSKPSPHVVGSVHESHHTKHLLSLRGREVSEGNRREVSDEFAGQGAPQSVRGVEDVLIDLV